jgi:hypothetical protein
MQEAASWARLVGLRCDIASNRTITHALVVPLSVLMAYYQFE